MSILKSTPSGCVAALALLLSLSQMVEMKERDYRGFSVIRSIPQTEDQLRYLQSLTLDHANSVTNGAIQFWTEPNSLNSSVDALVAFGSEASFRAELSRWNLQTETIIEDVGKAIRKTKPAMGVNDKAYNGSSPKQLSASEYYKHFQPYATMEAKLRQLAETDPRVVVSVVGKSSEGRNIYLVKVSNDFNAQKPIILIDAGHHAREWISHSTGMYLLESLVNIDIPRMSASNCKHDECVRETSSNRAKLNLNKYDFYFIPAVNPDGYEWSHRGDRLWRKTRSAGYCRGVDPNRNYPFHWRESGSSSVSCSEIYAGPKAASEPEVQTVVSVMDQYKDRVKMYLSLHCYSQLVLSPYGYARVYPKNYSELARVANAFMRSMGRLRGTDYSFGTSAMALYPSSGGSDDYAHSIGIPLAYTIELPDKGNNAFLTPPSEIIPIGHETLIGVQSMIDSI